MQDTGYFRFEAVLNAPITARHALRDFLAKHPISLQISEIIARAFDAMGARVYNNASKPQKVTL